MNKLQKIIGSVAILSSLTGLVNAREIICNREVEVSVPKVVNRQQERTVSQEVPVVCYQTEKRLVERTFVEPTCDPCNPFVTKTCQQEIEVQVPYTSKQIIEKKVIENVPVVEYHLERRIVPTRIFVDDYATPMPRTCAPATSRPRCDWYPGKCIGEFLEDVFCPRPRTCAPATSRPATSSPMPAPEWRTPGYSQGREIYTDSWRASRD